MGIVLEPVGHVVSSRREVVDDDWDAETATITLDADRFGPEALLGLDSFSHVEVVYHFDRVPPEKVQVGARHPRNDTNLPLTGIFAQRGKNRPNRIGVTVARVLAVDGLSVRVAGLDAVDGTPVLDLKPFIQEFAPRGEVRQPQWATDLMRDYWSAS